MKPAYDKYDQAMAAAERRILRRRDRSSLKL